jgi:hypothetical protein
VRNGLKSATGALGKERVERILEKAPLELLVLRPEKLTLQNFAAISNL